MKLNIGSGSSKLKGFINIDPYTKEADSQHDFFKDGNYPYEAGSIDEIVMFHCIEHIQSKNHPLVFAEFHRLLVPEGELVISYPEFCKCAQNYIENKSGMRDFWAATIYGRQAHEGDFHVSPINSPDFKNLLQCSGFKDIKFLCEPGQDFNTVCYATRGEMPVGYEELIFKDVQALVVK